MFESDLYIELSVCLKHSKKKQAIQVNFGPKGVSDESFLLLWVSISDGLLRWTIAQKPYKNV